MYDAATGDRQAFERLLYRRQVRRVFTLCVRTLGDQLWAEDVTHDVFVCWSVIFLNVNDNGWIHTA